MTLSPSAAALPRRGSIANSAAGIALCPWACLRIGDCRYSVRTVGRPRQRVLDVGEAGVEVGALHKGAVGKVEASRWSAVLTPDNPHGDHLPLPTRKVISTTSSPGRLPLGKPAPSDGDP